MRFFVIIAITAAVLYSVVPSTRASEDALSLDTLGEAPVAERDDFSEDDDDDKMVEDYPNEMDNDIYSLDEAEDVVAGRKTLNRCEEVAFWGFEVCIKAYCRRGWVTIIAKVDNKRLLKKKFSVKKPTFTLCTRFSGIDGCLYVTNIHTKHNGKVVSFKYRAKVELFYEGSIKEAKDLTC